MVKSIVSVIIAISLILGGAVLENRFVRKQFDEFNIVLDTFYEKVENKTANKQDAIAVQKSWIEKKKVLHIFIPHNDIKEVDLWVTETISLTEYEKFEDVLSKIDVLKELCIQIPNTFEIEFANIM